MTLFQLTCLIFILGISLVGGYVPLTRGAQTSHTAFAGGKAFTSGVFLALSLTVMLPGAFGLWQHILAHHVYPMATYIAIGVFVFMLAIEHRVEHLKDDTEPHAILIPILMTVLIGMCSFLLGTALGVSDTLAAIMVFIAIMAHKGSAAFALALTMVNSKMTKWQTWVCFLCFACATPLGIVLGATLHHILSGHVAMIFKATVTSIAAGVFLYLSTTYGLRHTPFVANCTNKKGFLLMLVGLGITILVSVLLNYAHHMAAT